MGNRLTSAGGSDSDYFRRQAYLQDSEALSEDLVRSIVGSDAFKDLRGLLGTTVEQALRKAVADSLKDPEIQKAIRDQLATTVISGLKKEIDEKESQILQNARQMLTAWEGRMTRVVGHEQDWRLGQQAVAREQARSSGRQDPKIDGQEPYEGEESMDLLGDRPKPVPPRKPLPSWLKPAAAAVGIVLALMVGLFLGKGFSQPESRREAASGATSSAREERIQEPETEESPLERLFVERMNIPQAGVEQGSELEAELQAHSYADQYRCWFDEETRRRLDDLLDNPGLKRTTFENTLRDAFAPCVATDYPVGTSRLPVFAAQGMVGFLLKREQDDGWDLCPESKKPAGLPDLGTFASDGKRGEDTYALLNGFLACIDRSAQLKIGKNSTSEEYLFTVYAALKELERR